MIIAQSAQVRPAQRVGDSQACSKTNEVLVTRDFARCSIQAIALAVTADRCCERLPQARGLEHHVAKTSRAPARFGRGAFQGIRGPSKGSIGHYLRNLCQRVLGTFLFKINVQSRIPTLHGSKCDVYVVFCLELPNKAV
jgi:hypothetical protein